MYEAFYKLATGPFQLMPDPRFLFPSKDHQRAMSYLMYGLQRREGFVVITGDVGIGKTMLVQTLIDEIGGRNLSAVRVAMANLDADGVMPMVASAFGLPYESRSKIGLLNDLVAKILPTYNRGALLIVDEAQTCTPAALEELRAISNLQARGRALLQIFLVGQTELRNTLARPGMEQLRQRVITTHHLRPLDLAELRAYILHRLAAVDWDSDPELAEEIHPRVHAWSRGIPRRINLLMDRLLLYGYLEEKHALDVSDVQVVIDELDAERGSETGWEQPSATIPSIMSASDGDALTDRIRELENAFTMAVGEQRAKQLLDKHEISAQQQALVALDLRIARMESLLADRDARDVLRAQQPLLAAAAPSTGAADAPEPEEVPASVEAPSSPAESPQSTEAPGFVGEEEERQDEFDMLRLRPGHPSETVAGHEQFQQDRRVPDGSQWLFRWRKRHAN